MKHIMQSQAMKKFIRNKRAMTGLAVVALLTLSVLLLPLVLDVTGIWLATPAAELLGVLMAAALLLKYRKRYGY